MNPVFGCTVLISQLYIQSLPGPWDTPCEKSLIEDGASVLLVPGSGLDGGRIVQAGEVGQVVLLVVRGVLELDLLQSAVQTLQQEKYSFEDW